MMEYHHTKLGLIWIKENKVTEGGEIRPPQVENVLNRPGEIGLTYVEPKGKVSAVVVVKLK